MSDADDNTPYVCSENVDITLAKLEEVGKVLHGFWAFPITNISILSPTAFAAAMSVLN